MHKIPAKTLFLGKNIVFVPECPSTNTLASELCQSTDVMDGSVVITDNQTAGRGQRGNTWLAQAGMNLTFSIIFKPKFLKGKDQFYLNMAVSLGIADYLKNRVTQEVKIKWPNDLLVNNKKICGILIENNIGGELVQQSVVGIGLNINQTDFEKERATSLLLISGVENNLEDEFRNLLEFIEVNYTSLIENKLEELRERYLSNLYQMNEEKNYQAEGKNFFGTIKGIDEWGRIKLNTPVGERVFGLKELVYN